MATFRNDTGDDLSIDRFGLYVPAGLTFEIPDDDAHSLAGQPHLPRLDDVEPEILLPEEIVRDLAPAEEPVDEQPAEAPTVEEPAPSPEAEAPTSEPTAPEAPDAVPAEAPVAVEEQPAEPAPAEPAPVDELDGIAQL